MKMDTECSETSAYKIQPPGNYPEESVQHRMWYCLSHVSSGVGDGAIPAVGWLLWAQNRRVAGRKELLHYAMRQEAIGYRHIILLHHDACVR